MEIKPCPFCGGEAHAHKANRFNWYVFCTKCNISTDGMLIHGGLERPKSEQEAIEHWNTRNNQSPEPESKKLDFGNHKCCKCREDTGIPIEDPFNGKIEMCYICHFIQYGVTKQEMQQNIMRRAKAKEDAINKILEGDNDHL